MNHHSFARSTILVLGFNSIQSLLPSTLISQLDSLLESHRLEDAYKLVDQRRKKLEETLHIDEDEARNSLCAFRSELIKLAGRRIALHVPEDWFPMLR